MRRSKLRNILNKDKNIAAISAYKRQRNLCTSLFRKAKSDYYSNLNPKCVSDNKKFWKTVKPLFSEKIFSSETITLVDKNVIYEEDNKVSEMFNDFFSSVVRNLNIEINNNALLLIHSYLTNRYQRVSINSNYSSWSEIFERGPSRIYPRPSTF